MSVISSVAAEKAGGGAARSSDATSARSGRSTDDRGTDPFVFPDPFSNGLSLPEVDLERLGAIVILADTIRRWINGR